MNEFDDQINLWVTSGVYHSDQSQKSDTSRDRAKRRKLSARRPLGSMNGNVLRAQPSARKRPASPADDGVPADPDLEATPRPMTEHTDLPRTSSSRSYHTSSKASKSTRSGRSSPTKQAARLAYIHQPIRNQLIDDWGNLPAAVSAIAERVHQLSRDVGTVPASMRPALEACLGCLPNLEPTLDNMASDPRRAELGVAPPPTVLLPLVNRAAKIFNKKHSEAAWNAEIHYPLLRLALQHSAHSTTLDTAIMTTARIEPPSLLPVGTAGEKAQSKMIDMAITLEESERLVEGVQMAAGSAETYVDVLNQTHYEAVFYNPIAVSIETKVPGGGLNDGYVQLSTWVSAQFSKMLELAVRAGCAADLPVLPLILVEGHHWTLMIAKRIDARRIDLYTSIDFGSSGSLMGMYRIIATLQFLMQWAEETFRTWWEEHIFPALFYRHLD